MEKNKFRTFIIEQESTNIILKGCFKSEYLIKKQVEQFQKIALEQDEKIKMFTALGLETYKLN